jgi:RNA polymerase sporulation-specific sigma factor
MYQDEELLDRARAGDDRAVEALLLRYRPIVRGRARAFFLPGADPDDVLQEGMIGLYKAVRHFDPAKGPPFGAFAELCVRRQILTAIASAHRRRNAPLNAAGPLAVADEDDEPPTRRLADAVVGAGADPLQQLVDRERHEDVERFLRTGLTPLEQDVLGRHLDGQPYDVIARALGRSAKAVDNALQRVRRKVAAAFPGPR